MQNPLQGRSAVQKTMVTLRINLAKSSWNETFKLLRDLERKFKTVGSESKYSAGIVWQIIIDEFDEQFWKNIAEGNGFELYSHKMDRHW